MTIVRFTIPGPPKGKGRPKFTRTGRTYTPKDTADYEELVKKCYLSNYSDFCFTPNVGLQLLVTAYYAVPKSDSKIKRKMKLKGYIRPMKAPDWDNVGKIIADSLNGIAYKDDAQIVIGGVEKLYADEPRVEVSIREVSIPEGDCDND